MLLAGMDVSGDPKIGNHKYLAIVIGTQQSILSLFKSIGKDKLHMKTIINKKERNEIINKISFDGNERMALCIRIDRNNTLEKIKSMRKSKIKNISEKKILRTFHYLLFQELKPYIESFSLKHSVPFSELVMQCDNDCINVARDVSLQQVHEGICWRISDAVAWCNNKAADPSGVKSLDLREKLERKTIERLLR